MGRQHWHELAPHLGASPCCWKHHVHSLIPWRQQWCSPEQWIDKSCQFNVLELPSRRRWYCFLRQWYFFRRWWFFFRQWYFLRRWSFLRRCHFNILIEDSPLPCRWIFYIHDVLTLFHHPEICRSYNFRSTISLSGVPFDLAGRALSFILFIEPPLQVFCFSSFSRAATKVLYINCGLVSIPILLQSSYYVR